MFSGASIVGGQTSRNCRTKTPQTGDTGVIGSTNVWEPINRRPLGSRQRLPLVSQNKLTDRCRSVGSFHGQFIAFANRALRRHPRLIRPMIPNGLSAAAASSARAIALSRKTFSPVDGFDTFRDRSWAAIPTSRCLGSKPPPARSETGCRSASDGRWGWVKQSKGTTLQSPVTAIAPKAQFGRRRWASTPRPGNLALLRRELRWPRLADGTL